MLKEFIICSAVHYDNGTQPMAQGISSGVVVCGRRHNDCNKIIRGLLGPDIPIPEREFQGFMTSFNRYVSRSEAFVIAKANNQIIHRMFDEDDAGSLTSEDLYGVDE